MCGRYALTDSADALARAFEVDARAHHHQPPPPPPPPPRYNIGPGQFVPVIVGAQLRSARWGWSAQSMLINARAETIRAKPSFRGEFGHHARGRRCLFPASAFYEWQHDGRHKGQPYAVRRADGGLFAMAGLWREHQGGGGGSEECVIITVAANALLTPVHPRMPAIVPQAHWSAWLVSPPDEAHHILKTAPERLMEAYPISRAVNKIANDEAHLLQPAAIETPPQMTLL